jgi:hypothetical protein
LADVLFRVDLWAEETGVSLFVGNSRFMSNDGGRKIAASQLLGDGPFHFLRMELPVRREYGTVHLPDPREVIDKAKKMRVGSEATSAGG